MELRLVSGDDWEGLYVGNELYAQGHEIQIEKVFEAFKEYNGKLSGEWTSEWVDQEWLEERGSLPTSYTDIPKEVFVD